MNLNKVINRSALRAYLDEQQLNICDFALLSRIPKSTLYRIFDGYRPSRKTAFKIINATKGKIKIEDLIYQ